MNIRGRRVVLRAIERADLDRLHAWANDADLWELLGGWHFPGSRETTDRWFASLATDSLNQRFAIEAPEHGLIGTANLVDIDWKNQHAFHGMMLGDPAVRGKGFGVDTIMAIMRFAFEELHFQRLDSTIIEYNTPSLKTYLGRCGWREEGRQRNWYFRKNRYWDRLLVGVTRDDYAALIARNRYWD